MNTIFNFSTFLKLVKVETYNFRKIYLYLAIALLSYFAIHIWQIEQGLTLRHITNIFGPFAMLSFVTAPFMFYSKLYDKIQGVDYAMLPANRSEKFLAALTQCAIIVPLFVGLITIAINCIIALVYNVNMSNLFLSAGGNYLDGIAGQSLAFWACFWFRRNKMRNLLLTLCALTLGGFLVSTLSLAIYVRIFTDLIRTSYLEYFLLYFADLSHFYLLLIFPLSLWLLSFYKLTRQQI